jgi:glycosyltransferase involved in cell wall biosynthesis
VPQRLIFALLRAASDLIAVSTESLVAPASRLGSHLVGVLPVGSNLPDARAARPSMRVRLGIREDQLVIAAFGTAHPSRLFPHLRRAVETIAALHPHAVILNLGASAPPLDGQLGPARVLTPGQTTAGELANYLATADLLLLPFSDGVATRRTTVMAGLQHGIPILGTDGVSTSVALRQSRALALVDREQSPDAYAQRACDLLADHAERCRLAQTGRELFEKQFAWPMIARRLVKMLAEMPRVT